MRTVADPLEITFLMTYRIWFALRAYLLTEVIWGLESKPATQHTTARNVAQLGSAPALGAGGRGFESRHSDDTGTRAACVAGDYSRLIDDSSQKRNEDGTFTVSEAWLKTALEDAIEKGMCVLFKLLQAYDAPVVVIDSVYRPTMELIIEIRTHRLFGE